MRRFNILFLFLLSFTHGSGPYMETIITADIEGYFGQSFGNRISVTNSHALISSLDGIFFYCDSDSGWTLQQFIERPIGASLFGQFIQLNDSTAFIGAPNDGNGKIYIYKYNGDIWEYNDLTSLSTDGGTMFGSRFYFSEEYAVIRAETQNESESVGSVYLFYYDGANWIEQYRLEGQEIGFGDSIFLNEDAVFIGNSTFSSELHTFAGTVLQFSINENNELIEVSTIQPDQPVSNSHFGSEIRCIDGRLFVSAPGENPPVDFSGRLYEFNYMDDAWIAVNQIIPDGGEIGEYFGGNFSVYDETLVVTSYMNSEGGNLAGKGYIFKFDNELSVWYQFKTIFPSDLSPGDWFGGNSSINENFVFISSPFRDNWSGATYVFDPHDNSLHSNFVADIRNGEGPVTVQFTSGAQGNPTAWEWDFNNDGTIDSVEENPQFTYQIDGLYSVSLTVHDEESSDMALKENYIQVTSDVIYGDLDNSGSLDVNDLVIFVAIILGDLEPTDTQLLAGDVNYSGEIDILDVVIAVDVILGM